MRNSVLLYFTAIALLLAYGAASSAEPDPYKALGVKRSASIEVIRAAFLKKTAELHPALGDSKKSKAFQNVITAYDLLSDPLARAEYDRQQKALTIRVDPFIEHILNNFQIYLDVRERKYAALPRSALRMNETASQNALRLYLEFLYDDNGDAFLVDDYLALFLQDSEFQNYSRAAPKEAEWMFQKYLKDFTIRTSALPTGPLRANAFSAFYGHSLGEGLARYIGDELLRADGDHVPQEVRQFYFDAFRTIPRICSTPKTFVACVSDLVGNLEPFDRTLKKHLGPAAWQELKALVDSAMNHATAEDKAEMKRIKTEMAKVITLPSLKECYLWLTSAPLSKKL